MKKVNRLVPDVQQRLADQGTEIVERHLAAYGVSRATDLPEEGKVKLMRHLRSFFHHELPDGLSMIDPRDLGVRGLLRRAWRTITTPRAERTTRVL